VVCRLMVHAQSLAGWCWAIRPICRCYRLPPTDLRPLVEGFDTSDLVAARQRLEDLADTDRPPGLPNLARRVSCKPLNRRAVI
jgi:hypothetical protein